MLHSQNTYFIIISEHFGPVPDFLLARTVPHFYWAFPERFRIHFVALLVAVRL